MGISLSADGPESELRQAILQVGSFVCFLFLLCGASRLARSIAATIRNRRNPGRLDRKYFVACRFRLRAGNGRCDSALLLWISIPYWCLPYLLLGLVALLGFLNGEHLAILVGQGNQLFSRRQPFQLIALPGDRAVRG